MAIVGRPPLSPDPVFAVVEADEEPELGAEEEQPLPLVVLHDRPGELVLGKVAGDVRPRHPTVVAPHHVGFEVALLVVVEHREHGVFAVARGVEVRDVAELGHAGDHVHRPPFDAPVIADLDAPVVHTGVEQAFGETRLVERHHVAVGRSGAVAPHRVHAPGPAHHEAGWLRSMPRVRSSLTGVQVFAPSSLR